MMPSPAANWTLELVDLEKITGEETENSASLQETVAKTFIFKNISSRFESHDIISAFAIFNPQKVPKCRFCCIANI